MTHDQKDGSATHQLAIEQVVDNKSRSKSIKGRKDIYRQQAHYTETHHQARQ
jgi:hypothetical protein